LKNLHFALPLASVASVILRRSTSSAQLSEVNEIMVTGHDINMKWSRASSCGAFKWRSSGELGDKSRRSLQPQKKKTQRKLELKNRFLCFLYGRRRGFSEAYE
jgi:hypothetical protein